MNVLLKYIPVVSLVVMVITIGILSLLPPESGFELKKDKLGHFLAYASLAANALYFSREHRSLITIFFSVICYGGLLELLQQLIPGREPSGLDLLANTSGAILGTGFHLLFGKQLKKLFG
jgi:VanZ family protein